ncbi:MAG: hypothetical protein PW735_12305 [Acidobacteriaceae bacterium]|nr:hypothetical protein [Acidobacteriaceae bacterium]
MLRNTLLPLAVIACVLPAQAQQPAEPVKTEVANIADLTQQAQGLLAKARAESGSEGITLGLYNHHKTMLTARAHSGGAELHAHFADFLLVLDGEGTELIGGTILNRTDGPDGESKGTQLEGAVPHPLRKGDILHIPAGTPHQAIEAPGQSIALYVIKVQESN